MKVVYGDERSHEAIAFLDEVAEVCKKHNKCIGHEDGHGSFIVEPLEFDPTCSWLRAASETIKES